MGQIPTEILIAPYLVLPDNLRIGPWRFVRIANLESSDALPDHLSDRVLDLVNVYRVDGATASLGAVVYPEDGQVGSPFDRRDMERLHKALLVGAVANNPMSAIPEEESGNAGHMTMTAENALLYGHPVGSSRSYVIQTGAIVRQMSLRTAGEAEKLPKVAPPVGLPDPLLATFDDDMAEASFDVLGRNDVDARRLSRTLDWCLLCFNNALEIGEDARITALRCAFEVLTGAGEETKKVVRAVEALLRDASTETVRYEPGWAKGPVEGTADGLWMTRFSELRNQIVHGDEVPAELWAYDGFGQQFQALDRLILGLKAFLARATEDESLRVPYGNRKLMLKWREVLAHAETPRSEETD